MSNSVQQFYLEKESNPGVLLETYPTYSGSVLSVNGKKDDINFFFREELSQELCFDYSVYEYIVNAGLNEVFYLHIYRDSIPFWKGTFTLTDCKIHPSSEHRTVKVKPKVYDQYTEVLELADKEYDLIKLAPPKSTVKMEITPVVQIYIAGSQHINNFIGGAYFESPVTSIQDDELQVASTPGRTRMVDDFDFIWRGFLIYIPGTFPETDLAGRYAYDGVSTDPNTGLTILGIGQNTTYYLEIAPDQTLSIVLAGTSTVVYQSETAPDVVIASGTEGVILTKTDASGDQLRVEIRSLFSRVVTPLDTFQGNACQERPEDDISAGIDTYPYAYAYGSFPIEQSYENQVLSTEYGRIFDDAFQNSGNFFVRPTHPNPLLPISLSDRVEVALWYDYDTDEQLIINESKEFIIYDAYNIADVLYALLQEMNTSLQHQGTNQFSTFLYGDNPLSTENPRWFITPKSNILAGPGASPALRSPIKLSEIAEYMRNKANLYWHITEDYEFIVEHASYYERGKSYSADQISTDLSQLYEPRTRKNYEYGLEEYSFDLQDMPNFIEFGWMDDVTRLFEGEQIEMTDKYILNGQSESREITTFTTDLAFAFISPDQVAKDGYFGLDCDLVGDENVVPIIPITFDGETFQVNNGYATFVYLHENYWKHFLPSRNVIINRQSVVATSIRKNKQQSLEYAEPNRFDPMKLVITGLGVARLKDYTIDLWTRYLKLTAKHDIE